MKRFKTIKTSGILLVMGIFLLSIPQAVLAVGTAADTTISNTVSVDYEVGSVAQTTLTATETFEVDQMLDLTVANSDGAAITVVPDEDDAVLTFTVTNDGNDTQDFSLSATAEVGGTLYTVTDNFDIPGADIEIYVESGATAGYQAAEDTDTYIDELAADASVTVYIVSDIPAGQSDGDGAIYNLVAQVAVGGTAATQGADITSDDSGTADDPDAVELVFADGAGTDDAATDGQHSDDGVYEVVTAALSVSKAVDTYSDPINGVSADAKAIPGAVMAYTIIVDNTSGSDTATSVIATDTIPGNVNFYVTIAPSGDYDAVSYSDDNQVTWTATPSAGGDGSDAAITDIRFDFGSIADGASEQAVFYVLVE